jgi:outer membrane biosynthesis protein TonB
VLIDDSGSVIAANAVSGHPLLRAAAVAAARNARFPPLGRRGNRVTGIITYNFVP